MLNKNDTTTVFIYIFIQPVGSCRLLDWNMYLQHTHVHVSVLIFILYNYGLHYRRYVVIGTNVMCFVLISVGDEWHLM